MVTALRAAVAEVVARDACSGCGLCVQLDAGLQMRSTDAGYLRPHADSAPDERVAGAAAVFRRACPGMTVTAAHPAGADRDPLLGSYVGIWEAWAADPQERLAGSSGGVLTALNAWLVASGRATRVIGAAADTDAPRRSVPVTIMTRDQALAAAGSRYAPVATLSNPQLTAAGNAITAKPCEISAVRAAGDTLVGDEPLLLSFFCAGTPSQRATDTLLADLGVTADDEVDSLRYRGNGWPGRFAATVGERQVDADYETSWGSTLGPTTQWRCKICPDGVGESADIVAADSWSTDERGYPTFTESAGVSALIARTERGRVAIMEAVEAGVIHTRPLEMAALRSAQPLQTSRRRFLWARLLGSRSAGRATPRYRGFGIIALGLAQPRQFIRMLRGTRRRVQQARRRD